MTTVTIGSGYGSSPVGRQVIALNNDDSLYIGSLETNFNQIWVKIHFFLSGKCT